VIWLSFIEDKNAKPEAVAEMALKDEKVLQELLDGVLSKKDAVRYGSFKALNFLSEKHPEKLYANWDFFANLLGSDNTHHKYIAIYILANLTKVDSENRFEKLFNAYYAMLGDKSVIPAAHVAVNSGKIALAKPKLRAEITNRLLDIDSTVQGHKDLVKAGAIEAFEVYFEQSEDKARIFEFVKAQLNCKSPKTRKKAKGVLEEMGKNIENPKCVG
jgi:hypothetical protein